MHRKYQGGIAHHPRGQVVLWLDFTNAYGLVPQKSGLPGKFKARVFQTGVLPRLLWSLLIYNVPLCKVETLEKRITGHLRK